MLLFLSDLHLMDGTAGKHQLEAETFREIFKELALQAREASKHLQHKDQEIKIILLGDIFELIRSESWFINRNEYGVTKFIGLDSRPWGNSSKETEIIANRILDQILQENIEIISVLSGREWEELGFPVKPELVYIPGNHDRLCNIYPSLRRKVIQALALKGQNPDNDFPSFYLNKRYGVFARHGHEWDTFNFEGDHRREENYKRTPIGDLIAGEIATKLPIEVEKKLENLDLSEDDKKQIADNFRNLFDVRPLSGIVPWLSYQVKRYDSEVQQQINRSFQTIGEDFLKLEFVQKWIKDHQSFWNPLNDGNKIRMLGLLFKTFDISSLELPIKAYEVWKRVHGIWAKDRYIKGAETDFKQLGKDFSYLIYGHTHSPEQHTINIADETEQMYLNTGTWRPKYYQALSKIGFSSRNKLTYTILYKKGEKIAGQFLNSPSFETWTGAQSREEEL